MTLYTILGGVLTAVISSWTTWFFTRKKYNTEVDNNQIKNMQESLEFYKKLSDDNRARLEEVLQRNNQLEKEVAQLREQVTVLSNELLIAMSDKVKKFEKENKTLKKKANSKIKAEKNKKKE